MQINLYLQDLDADDDRPRIIGTVDPTTDNLDDLCDLVTRWGVNGGGVVSGQFTVSSNAAGFVITAESSL